MEILHQPHSQGSVISQAIQQQGKGLLVVLYLVELSDTLVLPWKSAFQDDTDGFRKRYSVALNPARMVSNTDQNIIQIILFIGHSVSFLSLVCLLEITRIIQLLAQESDMVLVGGATVHTPQESGYTYVPDGPFSEDGLTCPYSESASGAVFTQGAGVVAPL